MIVFVSEFCPNTQQLSRFIRVLDHSLNWQSLDTQRTGRSTKHSLMLVVGMHG